MKISAGILVASCCLALACRGDKDLTRKGQQYNVVQEGSASAVTSTINGPGTDMPPVNSTPITGTGTNADTTTSFTLPTATEGSPGQAGNLAGTLSTDSTGRMGAMVPPTTQQPAPAATAPTSTPSARPRSAQPPRTATQPQRTEPSYTPPPPRENPPTTTRPAPPTDTTNTTTTSTSTDTQPPPKHHDNPPPDNNTPPPDQPPPPPPPTTTDTIGRP